MEVVVKTVTQLYPCGIGYSYTKCDYRKSQAALHEAPGGVTVQVSVDLTNTGPRAGDEVVQLYLRDEVASVTTPERVLKALRRVHLAAGETQAVHFELSADDLAVLDRTMKWVVEPGRFTVMLGASSADI